MKVRCQSDINICMENWPLPMTRQTCQSVLSLSWSRETLRTGDSFGNKASVHNFSVSYTFGPIYYSSCILQVVMWLCNYNLYGSPLFDKEQSSRDYIMTVGLHHKMRFNKTELCL